MLAKLKQKRKGLLGASLFTAFMDVCRDKIAEMGTAEFDEKSVTKVFSTYLSDFEKQNRIVKKVITTDVLLNSGLKDYPLSRDGVIQELNKFLVVKINNDSEREMVECAVYVIEALLALKKDDKTSPVWERQQLLDLNNIRFSLAIKMALFQGKSIKNLVGELNTKKDTIEKQMYFQALINVLNDEQLMQLSLLMPRAVDDMEALLALKRDDGNSSVWSYQQLLNLNGIKIKIALFQRLSIESLVDELNEKNDPIENEVYFKALVSALNDEQLMQLSSLMSFDKYADILYKLKRNENKDLLKERIKEGLTNFFNEFYEQPKERLGLMVEKVGDLLTAIGLGTGVDDAVNAVQNQRIALEYPEHADDLKVKVQTYLDNVKVLFPVAQSAEQQTADASTDFVFEEPSTEPDAVDPEEVNKDLELEIINTTERIKNKLKDIFTEIDSASVEDLKDIQENCGEYVKFINNSGDNEALISHLSQAASLTITLRENNNDEIKETRNKAVAFVLNAMGVVTPEVAEERDVEIEPTTEGTISDSDDEAPFVLVQDPPRSRTPSVSSSDEEVTPDDDAVVEEEVVVPAIVIDDGSEEKNKDLALEFINTTERIKNKLKDIFTEIDSASVEDLHDIQENCGEYVKFINNGGDNEALISHLSQAASLTITLRESNNDGIKETRNKAVAFVLNAMGVVTPEVAEERDLEIESTTARTISDSGNEAPFVLVQDPSRSRTPSVSSSDEEVTPDDDAVVEDKVELVTAPAVTATDSAAAVEEVAPIPVPVVAVPVEEKVAQKIPLKEILAKPWQEEIDALLADLTDEISRGSSRWSCCLFNAKIDLGRTSLAASKKEFLTELKKMEFEPGQFHVALELLLNNAKGGKEKIEAGYRSRTKALLDDMLIAHEPKPDNVNEQGKHALRHLTR